MVSFGEWLGKTDCRPNPANAPKTIDISDLLDGAIRLCMAESLGTSLEHGLAIGGKRNSNPIIFLGGTIKKGGEAHVSIALGEAPEEPMGTFHTHPVKVGETSGGHSTADLSYFNKNPGCIFMLVTEIAAQPSGWPRVIHHLFVRGRDGKLSDDFHKHHDTIVQQVVAQASGGVRANVTDQMLLNGQTAALTYVAKNNGFMYYKSKSHSAELELQ